MSDASFGAVRKQLGSAEQVLCSAPCACAEVRGADRELKKWGKAEDAEEAEGASAFSRAAAHEGPVLGRRLLRQLLESCSPLTGFLVMTIVLFAFRDQIELESELCEVMDGQACREWVEFTAKRQGRVEKCRAVELRQEQ
ncbi:hypothetical protein NDU88_003140 [Pleurodeles waltl]|uniref:Uncharacterized protein n=1 Tax=Pleurodeles waltl TaxID=8319 RepID=A0AAV7MPQ2_PLEWA|nr:hypothetical protein NDU88_003140 [Pleurodeles waltl]